MLYITSILHDIIQFEYTYEQFERAPVFSWGKPITWLLPCVNKAVSDNILISIIQDAYTNTQSVIKSLSIYTYYESNYYILGNYTTDYDIFYCILWAIMEGS